MIQKLAWYLNRLRCMSASEIFHRARVALQVQAERVGLAGAGVVPPYKSDFSAIQWIHSRQELNDGLAAKANRICEGNLNLFVLSDYRFDVAPNWNRDPKTGTVAPVTFGKAINYRDEKLVGDIKYLWESGRHLHLVTLAQAYASSRRLVYLQVIKAQLDSWFEQCPYLVGPHWISSLELSIRLINWSIVWQLLGGAGSDIFASEEGKAFRHRWLNSIYQHVHFVRGYYSGYSSANNHLIGEASGVFIASRSWPYWPEFERWGAEAKEILETEARQQNHPDGVNREQAVSYQQFVLDFLLLPLLCERSNGGDFTQGYVQVIESMLDFVASIMDIKGNMPMFGDADDGYVVSLSADPNFCPFRSLLATGAVLFNRTDYKLKASEFDQKSFALLGVDSERVFNNIAASSAELPVHRAFTSGGYYILGADFEEPSEVRMIMDVGPLGLGEIAAHGHADALSLYLTIAGKEILIDPGTYAYHTEQKWRNYFRGTAAHNTIRIDKADQSEIGGNFMWLRKANATLYDFQLKDTMQKIVGGHDGYESFIDPVAVQREVDFDAQLRRFTVTDLLSFHEVHLIEQFWHFCENATVAEVKDNVYLVSHGTVKVMFTFDSQLSCVLHFGDEQAPAGWISRSFDRKVPSNTLIAGIRSNGGVTLKTSIEIVEL